MSEQQVPDRFTKQDEENYKNSGFRQFGIYSSIALQMVAIIALGFWGGKKLNDYFELKNNLVTVGVGFLGMALGLYNTVKNLNRLHQNNK